MKKILIIGGTGYIGREIVKKLRNKNYEVAVLSRKSNTLKDIKCIQCSLLNKELLKEKINGFDVIIYSAGIVRTIMKWKYDENLPGVKNLVEAMNFNNIKKLIYFSTQYVYIDKTGPYGRSKKECDRIIENSGLDYIMVRPDFVYGIDKQHFYKLALLAKKTRILPIIGAAKRLQPINKEDVARVTISLIDYIEKYLNKKCMKVNIPFSLLKIFKNVLPFDLDSLTGDRLDRKMGNLNIDLKLSHTLEEDLRKIVEKL